MRRWLISLSLVLVTALTAAPAALAADIAPEQQRAVQQVVQAQLDAFRADDGARAFSFASDAIRRMFGTAEVFMDMVRTSYPVVYRPASVSFLKPQHDGRVVLQPVQMTDAEGRAWLAIYRLEAQQDKSWRIAGCVLAQGSAQST